MVAKLSPRSLVSDNASFLFELDLEVVSCISTTTSPRSLLTRYGALYLECALGASERAGGSVLRTRLSREEFITLLELMVR